MKAFFNPGIKLMNQLKYPQKFIMVGLVLVLPLAIVLGLFVYQINLVIDFAAKEQLGLQYNTPLIRFLQDTQQHAALVYAATSGGDAVRTRLATQLAKVQTNIEADVLAVDTLDQALGAPLDVSSRWTEVKKEWLAVKGKLGNLSQADAEVLYAKLEKQ